MPVQWSSLWQWYVSVVVLKSIDNVICSKKKKKMFILSKHDGHTGGKKPENNSCIMLTQQLQLGWFNLAEPLCKKEIEK